MHVCWLLVLSGQFGFHTLAVDVLFVELEFNKSILFLWL
jgi:hypothetical protein